MIYKDIDNLIAKAMKEKDAVLLRAYRQIKAEMLKAIKDGVTLDDANEAKILLKMAAQHEDSIKQFIDGGRPELAKNEQDELDVINKYLPKAVTDDEIADYTRGVITAYKMTKEDNYKLSMKDMKPIMTLVQEKYPTANGKIISKTLQTVL